MPWRQFSDKTGRIFRLADGLSPTAKKRVSPLFYAGCLITYVT
jgi:hypothetical protein